MSKSSASLETEIPADPTSLEVLAELPWLRRFPQRSPTLPPATHTNAYILGEHELVIVDPGTPSVDENNRLLAYLRTLSQDAERAGKQLRVIGIFLTHHHRDHVSGAAYLQRALQVPVWAHHQTAVRVEVLHREEDLRVHRIIEDGEVLELGGARFEALHTPGHAPGHLCLFDAQTRDLIAGDMAASVGTILIHPDDDGDMGQYVRELQRLLDLRPQRLWPAHGAVVKDAPSLLQRYLDHRHLREQKVLAALDPQPRSLMELLLQAYSDTPAALHGLASGSLRAHLYKLKDEGRAIETATNLWHLS
jgi:glyoxylase-like metal-dependent hydrolase (beta-lactamase superfamily II)